MEMLTTMIDYNYAEHRELWGILAALDESVFLRDSGYSWGSIQREVVHIIRADHLWFSRAISQPDPDLLPYETSDRAHIRAAWDALEDAVRAYIAAAGESILQEQVTYTNRAGQTITRQRWQLLAHLANHGTVHRAEICSVLHMLGHTVDFDVSLRRYLEERDLRE